MFSFNILAQHPEQINIETAIFQQHYESQD